MMRHAWECLAVIGIVASLLLMMKTNAFLTAPVDSRFIRCLRSSGFVAMSWVLAWLIVRRSFQPHLEDVLALGVGVNQLVINVVAVYWRPPIDIWHRLIAMKAGHDFR